VCRNPSPFITIGPDNTDIVLAFAVGMLIVGIVMVGSLWIMYHLNINMMVSGNAMNI
jgi:cytochrome o ubiquinol oxidase operon protein cyoD